MNRKMRRALLLPGECDICCEGGNYRGCLDFNLTVDSYELWESFKDLNERVEDTRRYYMHSFPFFFRKWKLFCLLLVLILFVHS